MLLIITGKWKPRNLDVDVVSDVGVVFGHEKTMN